MSKKLIAVMIAFALVFVGVFAACNNNEDEEETRAPEKLYIEDDELPFLEDESGEKILNEYGEFIVFATDEDGKYKHDDRGNRVTMVEPFQAYSKDNYVEDYGYRITLPENWVIDEAKFGAFINKETGDRVSIVIHDKSYQDVYESNFDTYEKLLAFDEVKVTWEENVEALGEECEGVVRFTMSNSEGMNVLYIFRNHGNIYKILFESKNPGTAVSESVAICKAISFKPFDYFEPVTDEYGKEVTDVFITQPAMPATEGEATTAQAE